MSEIDENYYALPEDFRIKSLDEMNSLNYSKYEGMITYFDKEKDIPEPIKTVEELNQVHEKAPIYYGRGGEKYGASAHLTKEAQSRHIVDTEAKAIIRETATDGGHSYSSMGGINSEYLSSLLLDDDYDEALVNNQQHVDDLDDDIEEEVEAILVDDDDDFIIHDKDTSPSLSLDQTNVNTTYVNHIEEEPYVVGGNVNNTNYIPSRIELANSSSNNVTPNVSSANVKTKDKSSGVPPTMISFGVAFLVACVLALLIVKFVAIPSILSGDSMNNTIMNGDKILIEKVSYRFSKPKRYDIVVFTGPDGSDYVKRIIGLPGEVITASEGYIYVNGQMLADDIYGKELMNTYNYGDLEEGIYLDDDEYCVLGDNRNDSLDSRNYVVGKLSSEDFKGRVCFKLWPLKAIK